MRELTDELIAAEGMQFLVQLHRVGKLLFLYEPNNDAVAEAIHSVQGVIDRWFGRTDEDLRLQLREDEAFVCGRLLKVDALQWERARELASLLGRFGVGTVTIERGITGGEVAGFIGAWAVGLRANTAELPRLDFGRLSLTPTSGRSMASFRFQPDRLALWLHCGLLDATELLYGQHAAGEAPSVLAVRRLLQMALDAFSTIGPAWQLLAQARDAREEPSPAALRVAVAADVIGLCRFAGVAKRETLILALAALLGDLEPDGGPDEAARPLLSLSGLGLSAMPLMLAVRDARGAAMGRPAGRAGALLDLVQRFHESTAGPTGQSLPGAVESLWGEASDLERASLAGLFAAYKGRWPLGSWVRLSNGRTGFVLGYGDHAPGQQAPTVAVLEEGRLGPRLDLQRSPVDVESGVPAASVGVNLTRL